MQSRRVSEREREKEDRMIYIISFESVFVRVFGSVGDFSLKRLVFCSDKTKWWD